MTQFYWKTMRAQCCTERLRRFNNGDLTDTIMDILFYLERAFERNGILQKDRIQVTFTNGAQVSRISENLPNETTEFTFTVGSGTFDIGAIRRELEAVEMWPDFLFFEKSYDEFKEIG